MKLLLLLFCTGLFGASPASLLIIDMNGKKPVQHATSFSIEQYLLRSFPIYANDLKAVIEATEKAAKRIDQKPACDIVDTVNANHTVLIIHTECSNGKGVTVRLVTRIAEQNFLCDFELVKKEEDFRSAQVKLLDFAAYLSQ